MTATDADFAELARAHGPLIGRIARSYEANAARAEELVQDIYLSVWQAMPRFRGDASMRTFVARIAHNRAISHVAREARAPRLVRLDEEMPAGVASPEDAAEQSDLRAKLEAAVQRLPMNQKLVVTLALEGFSAEEIASVLGVNVSAASVRLHRAKAALQDMLKGSVI
jgi:RNA polymerase sigma-70 factor (ECF subfamily)